jgi:hypothetical protein
VRLPLGTVYLLAQKQAAREEKHSKSMLKRLGMK